MTLLIFIVALALVFDFTNGFHDAANAIATSVATKVLTPLQAVCYAGLLNFIGACWGTEVAATIGSGLVDAAAITLTTMLCTLLAAIVWNLLTWWKGLPTSSSHALIGSLLGAAFFSSSAAIDSIHVDKFLDKVLWPMLTSPVLGFIVGFALMAAIAHFVLERAQVRTHKIFRTLQIFSAGFMALMHGRNDAQKSMGIIALALVVANPADHFTVPLWVIISCAIAMGLGTLAGGWRIVKTLGLKIVRLAPPHGFAAETTAASIIGVASHFGIPVSTTQVISSAIIGVGASKKPSSVRWGVFGNIVWAWVLTLPLTFGLGGLFMLATKFFTQ